MKRLFVRSGGGVPGLDIHAGIWMALDDAGITSTHNSGCSAGAIVAGADSSGFWSGDTFARFISALSDKDIRRKRFAWQLRMRWIDHIYDSRPIFDLIGGCLPPTWEKMVKPTQIWASRVQDGRKTDVADPSLSGGPCMAALASAAIPMIFPSVTLGGDEYWDGGLRFNVPLPANWREYDEVYLLIASAPLGEHRKSGGLLTHAIRAVKMLMYDQTLDVLEECLANPRVRVIWPDVCDRQQGFLHFDHNLISRAYQQTKTMLDGTGMGKE